MGNLRIAKVARCRATVCGNTVARHGAWAKRKSPAIGLQIRSIAGLGVRRRRLGGLPFGSSEYATLSGWI